MEWTESIRGAIKYIENHLLDQISAEDAANEVHMSSFYLQRGFKFMTGYSIGEYIRCRRLYLAALDVISDKEKTIEIAYKYRYDTPEGFTKAFRRFHGCSPMQLKKDISRMNVFLPLKIKIIIQGGNEMDYVVEKMQGFKVIGFEREFSVDNSYQEIPKFWDEFCEKYCEKHMTTLDHQKEPKGEIQQVICDCCIGEYGICIDDIGKDGRFRYLIAGTYHGGNVPDGMIIFEFPDMEWAKFNCTGPMPGALQSVNTKIFNEWLPGNPDYEIAMGANIEWYAKGDIRSVDYESGIWIPVSKKSK